MNRVRLRALLDEVRIGTIAPSAAYAEIERALRERPFEDLAFARIDHHREWRQGFPEVIFGIGKTPAQIAAIAQRITERGQPLLVTKTTHEAFQAVRERIPEVVFHEAAAAITLRRDDVEPGRGVVLVVSAGTADVPIAEEAAVTVDLMGNRLDRLYDVGVAGLHRLLAETDRLQAARVVIVVAGMEAALPSVVGGLVKSPVIAVPSSAGYGASFGGVTALLGMLTSCAAGVAVVNIDNGFGAGFIASIINHL